MESLIIQDVDAAPSIHQNLGKSAYPVGKIALEVVFGDELDSRSKTLTFEVVKIQSPYHALFGRPAYAKFMARPCYVYL